MPFRKVHNNLPTIQMHLQLITKGTNPCQGADTDLKHCYVTISPWVARKNLNTAPFVDAQHDQHGLICERFIHNLALDE